MIDVANLRDLSRLLAPNRWRLSRRINSLLHVGAVLRTIPASSAAARSLLNSPSRIRFRILGWSRAIRAVRYSASLDPRFVGAGVPTAQVISFTLTPSGRNPAGFSASNIDSFGGAGLVPGNS
jgi:hypothetical protein